MCVYPSVGVGVGHWGVCVRAKLLTQIILQSVLNLEEFYMHKATNACKICCACEILTVHVNFCVIQPVFEENSHILWM